MRLASLKANILSGPHLQMIIEKLNLYPDLREKTAMSDLVGKLKQAVDVELLPPMPGSWGRPPGFQMSVTFDQPKAAQQICTEITSLFMEQNSQRRMEQTQKTTEFVSKELLDAKAKLDEQDQKLAEFKRHYLGILARRGAIKPKSADRSEYATRGQHTRGQPRAAGQSPQ